VANPLGRSGFVMPAATSKRSRTNDPANTRSRILDAAARLFHHKGYNETSIQDIMRAASVTGGALHHHYRTKKDVGLAVIRERVAKIVDEVWIDPMLDAADPVTGVTDAIRGIIQGLGKEPIAGCPLNNLAVELGYADPDFRVEIQAIFEKWQSALADRIAQSGVCSNNGDGLSPAEIATFIVASYSGAMTLAKSAQSADPLNATMKVLARGWPTNRAAA
jgi:AcrR family transcriptional regulator